MNIGGLTLFELITHECMWLVSDCLTDALYLVVKQVFIMDPVIYDTHIIHYHMNSSQSVALDQG